MQSSTVLQALAGGAMIGTAASFLLFSHGRIAGISGILGAVLRRQEPAHQPWRLAFLIGLLLSGVVGAVVVPGRFGGNPVSLPLVAVAGLLVGLGTCVGNGCTSGHGVCGISRLSKRSIVATMVFMAVAAITVWVVREAGGWS